MVGVCLINLSYTFTRMSDNPLLPDVSETAFECVYVLGVRLNLKNEMLSTAVAEGRLNVRWI